MTQQPYYNIVLMGAPGSGKGTQAALLSNQLNIPHIATGNIFRENLNQQTDLGKLAKTYMDKGDLVPDDVTEAMVQERLSRPDTKPGFILDGFPRTPSQADALNKIVVDMTRQLSGVLYIKVSDKEIIERLSGRLICGSCQQPYHKKFIQSNQCPKGECNGEELYQRNDDKLEAVQTRLEQFHQITKPLANFYSKAGLLIEIEGEGDIEAVTDRVINAVKSMGTR